MNNRIYIALGVLVVLIAGTVIALQQREERLQTPSANADAPELPEIERDNVTELVLSRPSEGEERSEVRLVRSGEGESATWRMVEPVESPANVENIGRLLDALSDLDVDRVAATRAEVHERLEVDAAHGVHVTAKGGDETLLDFWLGTYGNNATMIRLEGEDRVLAVRGNIKYHFNREVREWRDRHLVDRVPNDVVEVSFQNGENTFHFVRPESDWELAEDQAPIERFGGSKVQRLIATLARLRGTDFAPADVTPAAAGFDAPAGTVTLVVEDGHNARLSQLGDDDEPAADDTETDAAETDEAETDAAETDEAETDEAETDEAEGEPHPRETIVVEIGGRSTDPAGRYARVRGGEFIYVLSGYTATRALPSLESFQLEEGEDDALPEPSAASPMQMDPNQIPPEILQQLQQQLQQQGVGH